jgi:hypothetical protein|uniref:DUF6790 family protein n=1 Tax=unclassified Variovorax TaxID=663243 RepID=UPI000D3B2BC2
MYYAAVTLLMFVLPAASIVAEWASGSTAMGAALVLEWYVFWAVGCRLSLAGLRQIIQPAYTAQTILGHQGDESLLLVRELGFANVSIGAIGLASFFFPSWRLPAALAGGIFYLLAGVNHTRQAHRNRLENMAMVSDLVAGAVLLLAVLGGWPR